MAFSRLNGSVAPERFTTVSCICSTVVNRFSQTGHWRRRRIAPPSSATRLSTTRESACRQYGQCTNHSSRRPPRGGLWISLGTTCV